ncbi:LysR family transcriptional regulator [Burkholderia sp. Ac-20365]|uniref:LysR family transcriptional regulator n=1 Tax=Burkholderia sp. Ac-20365 TaxID=2703897 RepID=UPI00197BE4A4|nr:LysR family transcriptional regulator [Burkholderia sp. Ac-20365]MBN3765702.1 LysR family transcriptional regulator [Burkholderia sp. Ac-20365]
MVDLDDMRMFRALGTTHSLAGAARLLDVTPPALTVRLQKLEERLGVHLAVREARGISLTEEGTRLMHEAIDLLERLETLPERIAAEHQAVSGSLRIVAPLGFGRVHIAPVLRDFHLAYPNVTASLNLSDNPLADSAGADVVIHIGEMKDSSWVAHVLAPNERFLCASPRFAASLPALDHPSALAHLPCLCLRENDEDVSRWRFEPESGRKAKEGKAVTVRVTGALSSNDGGVIGDWAMRGLGIMVRSEWDAGALIASGKLRRLLPQWRLAPAPIVALVPTRKGVPARVRLFLDAARAAMDPPPWRR